VRGDELLPHAAAVMVSAAMLAAAAARCVIVSISILLSSYFARGVETRRPSRNRLHVPLCKKSGVLVGEQRPVEPFLHEHPARAGQRLTNALPVPPSSYYHRLETREGRPSRAIRYAMPGTNVTQVRERRAKGVHWYGYWRQGSGVFRTYPVLCSMRWWAVFALVVEAGMPRDHVGLRGLRERGAACPQWHCRAWVRAWSSPVLTAPGGPGESHPRAPTEPVMWNST
jgi:hypothetical protein